MHSDTQHSRAGRNAMAGTLPNSPPPVGPVYYTVGQMAEAEPALGKGAIRDDLFHRKANGLEASGAVIYRGRRILLHRELYLEWLVKRSMGAAA